MTSPIVSVIIPVYNEEKDLGSCLLSIKSQTVKNIDLIVVDDGSADLSKTIAEKYNVTLLEQSHKGPGSARNFGAKHAKGEILIFVDADMTFEKYFIDDLTKPIVKGQAIGTFSKNEMVSNTSNPWSVCWNINRNIVASRMLPINYPNEAPVYRAILKKEFEKAGGFETSGDYTDDWSLSEKLGIKAKLAQGAVYYHSNPSTLKEVWQQARWIGRNRFLTGSLPRKIKSLMIYCMPCSITVAIVKSFLNANLMFIFFKLSYDSAVFLSVAMSFFNKQRSK